MLRWICGCAHLVLNTLLYLLLYTRRLLTSSYIVGSDEYLRYRCSLCCINVTLWENKKIPPMIAVENTSGLDG